MRRLRWTTALAAVWMFVAAVLSLHPGCSKGEQAGRTAVLKDVDGLMGTKCQFAAIVGDNQVDLGNKAIDEAIAEFRRIESVLSIHGPETELTHLNQAAAGEFVPLSAETLDLLKLSRRLAAQTNGAFDVTVGPMLRLWAQAGERGRVPTEAELAEAMSGTGWQLIELLDGGARKRSDAASVDLGGIAKGYAIDRALAILQQAGCAGGLVNAGGDIRCFGFREDGTPWRVGIDDPFQPGKGRFPAKVALTGGSVCTSGNYYRYSVIAGTRYGHIIDPRSGTPAEAAPSVTIVAPTAVIADAWATALSVLGPNGLKLLGADSGIEAMLITGQADEYQMVFSPGFSEYVFELQGEPIDLAARP